MFFPPLGVNVMVGFVPLVEPILDKRPKHAMLLVDAIEERTNVTMLAENTLGKRGGLHILTFTQGEALSRPTDRFGAARFDPAPAQAPPALRRTRYSLRPPYRAVDGWSSRRAAARRQIPASRKRSGRLAGSGVGRAPHR